MLIRPEVSAESDYILFIYFFKLHLGQFFVSKTVVLISFAYISIILPQLVELVPPRRVGIFR